MDNEELTCIGALTLTFVCALLLALRRMKKDPTFTSNIPNIIKAKSPTDIIQFESNKTPVQVLSAISNISGISPSEFLGNPKLNGSLFASEIENENFKFHIIRPRRAFSPIAGLSLLNLPYTPPGWLMGQVTATKMGSSIRLYYQKAIRFVGKLEDRNVLVDALKKVIA